MQNARCAPCILLCLFIVMTMIGCGSAGSSSTVSSPVTGGGTSALTVSILSPSPNTTVTGPFRVHATASQSSNLMLRLMLDGTEIFSARTDILDTTISASNGPHRLTVQATDATGKVTEASIDIVASSAPASVPPTFSTVFDRIEESGEWQTCGNCGNSGGAVGNVATYRMERGITSPSTDGSAARFSIGGPYPYTNGYWWTQLTAPSTRINRLRYEFDLYIPSEFSNASQAIEFECQQQVGGYIYNFAWQADFSRKEWRTFDFVNRRWDPAGLPTAQLTPGTWHHIITEYHTEAAVVIHDALTIDTTRYTVNLRHPASYVGGTSKQLTSAFQLDLNKVPTPYAVYVDGMKVSYN